jgi:hypothetical protein
MKDVCSKGYWKVIERLFKRYWKVIIVVLSIGLFIPVDWIGYRNMQVQFEGVTESRKSKMDIQYMVTIKRTNNNLLKTTQNNRATRTSLKPWVNSDTPERLAVTAPLVAPVVFTALLVTPVVLLLNDTNSF